MAGIIRGFENDRENRRVARADWKKYSSYYYLKL
jgi:hypothetical protein